MKYRSLTLIYFTWSIFESHWSIIPIYISPSNNLQDMKQNRCTIKYRRLTYIYLLRSIYVSHWSIIPTIMFIHQIILKILNKITRSWNIGHVDLYLLWGQSLVTLSHYLKIWHLCIKLAWRYDKITGPWNIGSHRLTCTFILRSNVPP